MQSLSPIPQTARTVYLSAFEQVLVDDTETDGQVQPWPEVSSLVATFSRNLEPLGYTLAPELATRLLSCSREQITRIYQEVVSVLQQKTGAHRTFRPLYPNFPQQVMDATEAELFLGTLAHSLTAALSDLRPEAGPAWRPEFPSETRPPLPTRMTDLPLRWLHLGSMADFEARFRQMLAQNGSPSPADKEVVTWFVQQRRDRVEALLPEVIPQKETLAFLFGLLAR